MTNYNIYKETQTMLYDEPQVGDICNRVDDNSLFSNRILGCDAATMVSDQSDRGLSMVIYRYKFTEDFMEELHNFAKIHQYDHRKDFKEAWKIWTEENADIVQEEVDRLDRLGYDGDILDKMFKSARYYFRKKSTEKKEPRQRRVYISVQRELLDVMDQHIEENALKPEYQPKTGYAEFCKEYEMLIKEVTDALLEKTVNDLDLIEEKIKKTYKNRYFMFAKNSQGKM